MSKYKSKVIGTMEKQLIELFEYSPAQRVAATFVLAGLTEENLIYILSQMTKLKQADKVNIHNAFRDMTISNPTLLKKVKPFPLEII